LGLSGKADLRTAPRRRAASTRGICEAYRLNQPFIGVRAYAPWLLAGSVAALVAALAAAVARSHQPFEHGWWLVAYLALVGALSQFLLASGQLAFIRTRCRIRRYGRLLRTELVLWNLGTVLVPAGVFATVPAVVALGSLSLLAALALFARATTIPRAGNPEAERRWLYAYRIFLVFLAGSVLVGTGLHDAFRWQ
jgi:hypothetical protein